MIRQNKKWVGCLTVAALGSLLAFSMNAQASEVLLAQNYNSQPYSTQPYSTQPSPGYTAQPNAGVPGYQAPQSYGNSIAIPNGTTVVVRSDDPISSDNIQRGGTLNFRVARDVKVYDPQTMQNYVVIKSGAPAQVVAADSESSGSLGEGGKLTLVVRSAQAVDRSVIGLSGSAYMSGEDNTGSTLALSLLLCPLFLLREGDAAEFPAGFEIRARTAGTNFVKKR